MSTILHVITSIDGGGAETVLGRLIAADRGNTHHVVSLMRGDARELGSAAARVDTLDMPSGVMTLTGAWRLAGLIRRINPDVVQTWMYHADLIGGLIARLVGSRPVIWGLRNGYLDRAATSLRTRLVANSCALLSHFVPTTIVSCSAVAARLHIQRGYARAKMQVIANGYDYDVLRRNQAAGESLRAQWGIGPNTFLYGMVARWDRQKDHANLIAALKRLKHFLGIDWRCALVGSGMISGNGRLVELLEEHEVIDRVLLCGSYHNVAQVMSALDVHVLSSMGEAFPNVVGEAMCCGTPCIATNVGDTSYLLGETGWLVPARAPDQLASAMARAAEELVNPDQRRKRQWVARMRIVREFGIEKMVEGFREVWSRALAEYSPQYSTEPA